MSARRGLSEAVTLIAVASDFRPTDAQAQGKGIRLWNLTTATISGFQLSPAGKDAGVRTRP